MIKGNLCMGSCLPQRIMKQVNIGDKKYLLGKIRSRKYPWGKALQQKIFMEKNIRVMRKTHLADI